MKINKLFYLFLLPLSVYAQSFEESESFKRHPQPYAGVKVVPIEKRNFTAEEKLRILHNINEQKKFGFIRRNFPEPKQLMNFQQEAKLQMTKNKYMNDPRDSSIKDSLEEVKLAFSYNGLPFIEKKNIIGYTPMGQWLTNGWSGVNQTFIDKDLGTCMLSMLNVPLNGTSSIISAENARYDINNSANTLTVIGSEDSGFLYVLEWANKNFNHRLECANKVYYKSLTEKLVQLAKKIESETVNAKLPVLDERTKNEMLRYNYHFDN